MADTLSPPATPLDCRAALQEIGLTPDEASALMNEASPSSLRHIIENHYRTPSSLEDSLRKHVAGDRALSDSAVAALEKAGYRVIRKLGQGAFGTAHLIEKNGKRFVVKEGHSPESLIREAEAISALPQIPPQFFYFPSVWYPTATEFPYQRGGNKDNLLIAALFEKCPGCHEPAPALSQRIKEQFLDPQENPVRYQHFVRSLLDSVAVLHTSGRIIHRDIKPENILVDDSGNVGVIDYGMAIDGAAFGPTTLSGTLKYVSPSALRGNPPSPLDDIHALRITLRSVRQSTDPNAAPLINVSTDYGVLPLHSHAAELPGKPDRVAMLEWSRVFDSVTEWQAALDKRAIPDREFDPWYGQRLTTQDDSTIALEMLSSLYSIERFRSNGGYQIENERLKEIIVEVIRLDGALGNQPALLLERGFLTRDAHFEEFYDQVETLYQHGEIPHYLLRMARESRTRRAGP
ncbi:MAG: phosphotransferase [Bdellovibrionales bacterium]|nr:phosphotransferase [Bdellovibrionales bacterium]